MNCKKIESLIPMYVENDLSEKDKIIVQQHMEQCSNCRYLYENLVSSLNILREKEEIPEQAFYYTALKQKMQNKYANKPGILDIFFKSKVLQPVMYLASIVIAVFIGIQIGSNSNNSTYSSVEDKDKSHTEVFAESQLMNGFEIETIENTYFNEDTTVNN